MWQKIQTTEDINKLSSGAIVVKYPVAGDPDQGLDLNDTNNLLRYEIYSIDKENEIAGLRMFATDISDSYEVLESLRSIGTVETHTLILKSINEFVSDNIWWYELK
ncbi:MAG TPA: hypothetical protein VGQ09_06250 [Chitinophagaceae bacterium]|jgi:hypothetical protein|nr:hypothetical protein [Chitinophagaceae bacterium]